MHIFTPGNEGTNAEVRHPLAFTNLQNKRNIYLTMKVVTSCVTFPDNSTVEMLRTITFNTRFILFNRKKINLIFNAPDSSSLCLQAVEND